MILVSASTSCFPLLFPYMLLGYKPRAWDPRSLRSILDGPIYFVFFERFCIDYRLPYARCIINNNNNLAYSFIVFIYWIQHVSVLSVFNASFEYTRDEYVLALNDTCVCLHNIPVLWPNLITHHTPGYRRRCSHQRYSAAVVATFLGWLVLWCLGHWWGVVIGRLFISQYYNDCTISENNCDILCLRLLTNEESSLWLAVYKF